MQPDPTETQCGTSSLSCDDKTHDFESSGIWTLSDFPQGDIQEIVTESTLIGVVEFSTLLNYGWQPWGYHRNISCWKKSDPGGFVSQITSPQSGKLTTLLHDNPPGRPRGSIPGASRWHVHYAVMYCKWHGGSKNCSLLIDTPENLEHLDNSLLLLRRSKHVLFSHG